MWTAARAALADDAARRSASRCRSRRARPRAGNWYDAEYVVLWNGIEVDRFAVGEPDAVAAAGRVVHRPARAAQGSRGAARRVGGHRPRRRAVGRRRRPADRRAARRARRRTSSGSARSPTPSATRGCAARPCSARRRCAASRSASCCSRRWPRARRSSRRRSRATATSRAPTATRCSCRPATSARCATRCGACSTTPRCATGSSRPGRERAERVLDGAPRRALPRALRARRSCRPRDRAIASRSTRLALDLAARVRDAVAPSLGDSGRAGRRRRRARAATSRWRSTRSPSRSSRQCCAEAGDIAFYSEDRGYVEFGRPRAILVVDPIDGTRPAAAGLESCCVSVAVLPPSRDATLGDVAFGVVHEIKPGQRFFAARGGRDAERADGRRCRSRCRRTSISRAVLDRRAARPSRAADDGRARGADRRLVDARRLLRPRLGDVQHDADRHRPARRVRRHRAARRGRVPRDSRPRSAAVGDGAVCTNFPYDVAAAALDRRGGGRRRDRRRRRRRSRPSRRSVPATATAWRCSPAPRRRCTTGCSTRSSGE